MNNCIFDDSLLPPVLPSGDYYVSFAFINRSNRRDENLGFIKLYMKFQGKPYTIA